MPEHLDRGSEVDELRILVPRLIDLDNNNPQCLNTRAILSRASNPACTWKTTCYGEADPEAATSANVEVVKLWRGRFWAWRMLLFYSEGADAIFYPGPYWFDRWGLWLRRMRGRKVPIIATLEGLVGDEKRQAIYSSWAGHPVYCHQVSPELLAKIDRVLGEADHVIAISPFLAAIGSRLYGDKFSVLPLGVDRKIFFPAETRAAAPFTVVGAGRLYENKRPQLFIEMARRFPSASFVWYGDGELLDSLQRDVAGLGVRNVEFRGAMANRWLGDEFRNADLFVLPSRAEGVPKVTQEAAACGLPVIVFGFYEAPTVRDGDNGYVVWNDEQLFARVGALIADPISARRMGRRGAYLAAEWDWERLAPLWEQAILDTVYAR